MTEDHVVLAGRITEGLRDAGLAPDVVNDGSAALTQAGLTAYDVIVLDRDLPVVHGDQVCRTLAGGSARILMLTATCSASACYSRLAFADAQQRYDVIGDLPGEADLLALVCGW